MRVAIVGRGAQVLRVQLASQFEAGLEFVDAIAPDCALTLLLPSEDDEALRAALMQGPAAWSVVHDLDSALDALTPLLLQLPAARPGLFTRLQSREAAQQRPWEWLCDCDVPECEHAEILRCSR
jgi:hypothetical protein